MKAFLSLLIVAGLLMPCAAVDRSPIDHEDEAVVKLCKQQGWSLECVKEKNNRNLVCLDIGVPDESLFIHLAKSKVIQSVTLRGGKCKPEHLKHIAMIPTLESIRFDSSSLTDEGLSVFAKVPKLSRITINYSDELTGSGFAAFANSASVTSLEINECKLLSNDGIKAISSIPQLEELVFFPSPIVTDYFEFPTLGTAYLFQLAKLKRLYFINCELSEKAVVNIGKVKSVKKLWIVNCKMSGNWLEHLAGLTEVEECNLSRNNIEDNHVKHLMAFPKLHYLELDNTRITDLGLVELSLRPPLRCLSIRNTPITKDGHKEFKKIQLNASIYSDGD